MANLKVTFGPDRIIEVEADNIEVLGQLVNRSIKKFFFDDKIAVDQKEDF